MRFALCTVLAAPLLLPAILLADAPATMPSTRPVYTLTMPPGMEQVTVGQSTAICPAHYVELVRKGLAQAVPATRPTTMASDILQNLAAERKTLQAQMVADFNLPPDQVGAFLDGPLKAELEKVADSHNRWFIIVASQEEMTAAMKTGWQAPFLHYNKLADHTFYQQSIAFLGGVPKDDIVLWSEVSPGESDAEIVSEMNHQLQEFRGDFLYVASQVALGEANQQFFQFLDEKVTKPLNLPNTEQWFTLGVKGAMSCKYVSIITGRSRQSLVTSSTGDSPNRLIQSGPLDLLHEFDTSVIKPQYVPVYLDAVNRKATVVIEKLVEKAGDACLLKIFAAIRAKPPADGAALAALIKAQTGVDLTDDLSPVK